jgi:5-formyltetrahydrofolate cyclo-ligase
MDKAEIRKAMLARRWALASEYINEQSDKIFERLMRLDEVKQAENIMTYSHFSNEVKTGKLTGWLLFHGKRVFLPVVDDEKILVADISSACFEVNKFGISQPQRSTACVVEPKKIDLFIIPGIAFDSNGNRIGFGKGYYDNVLFNAPGAFKIGLAYDFQITEQIFPEAHDVKMDMVVTPEKIFRRKES